MPDPSAFDPQDYLPDWLKRVTSPGSDPGSDSILGHYSGIPLPSTPPGLDARQWQGSPPATVLNPNPVGQGATGLGDLTPVRTYPDGTALVPAGAFPAVTVKPDLLPGDPNPAAGYPSPFELAGILYNETGSQQKTQGGPDLDPLRNAMANAVLNAIDQKAKARIAGSVIPSKEMNAISSGLLHPGQTQGATNAWLSSLKAAQFALHRASAPTTGPGSGVFFNGRPDASTAPNPNVGIKNGAPAPFVGTIGPYNNAPSNPYPYWAFFTKPK